MALGQLLSYPTFLDAIAVYRIGGQLVVSSVAWLLAGSEILAGVGLLAGTPSFRVKAGWAGVALATVWTLLAFQALVRGLDVRNCGCFGRFLVQQLSWLVLVQDAYFVGLAYLALRSARTDAVPSGGES